MSKQSMTTNSNTPDTKHPPLNPINHNHSMELELLPIEEWSSLETKLLKLGLGAMIEHQDQIRAQPTMAMQLNTLYELELTARHQKSFTYRQKASKLPIHKPYMDFFELARKKMRFLTKFECFHIFGFFVGYLSLSTG